MEVSGLIFDKYDLVDHHIKSYNDFVNNRIQEIIDMADPITLKDEKNDKTYHLKTGKVNIQNHLLKKQMVLRV